MDEGMMPEAMGHGDDEDCKMGDTMRGPTRELAVKPARRRELLALANELADQVEKETIPGRERCLLREMVTMLVGR